MERMTADRIRMSGKTAEIIRTITAPPFMALLPMLGFSYCDEITLASGDSRKAFEKPLGSTR